MTLHADINLAIEVLEDTVEDDEAILVNWVAPMLPAQRVANARLPGAPTPFVLITHLDSNESVETGFVDDLVSVHCLYPAGDGNANRGDAAVFCERVHRRILLLSRYLSEVTINGRSADYDYLDVAMRPRWETYGDERILRKVSRYRMGRTYAKLS